MPSSLRRRCCRRRRRHRRRNSCANNYATVKFQEHAQNAQTTCTFTCVNADATKSCNRKVINEHIIIIGVVCVDAEDESEDDDDDVIDVVDVHMLVHWCRCLRFGPKHETCASREENTPSQNRQCEKKA